MKVPLKDEQLVMLRDLPFYKRRLAIQACDWIAAIQQLCKRVGNAGDERPDPYQTDLHMLALSLEHLDSCVRLLGEANVALCGATEFIDAWERISDIRDALEHEEEYLAGGGKRPELKGGGWSDVGRPMRSVVWGALGPSSVSALGKNYHVEPAIRAALRLEEELAGLAKRLDTEARGILKVDDHQI